MSHSGNGDDRGRDRDLPHVEDPEAYHQARRSRAIQDTFDSIDENKDIRADLIMLGDISEREAVRRKHRDVKRLVRQLSNRLRSEGEHFWKEEIVGQVVIPPPSVEEVAWDHRLSRLRSHQGLNSRARQRMEAGELPRGYSLSDSMFSKTVEATLTDAENTPLKQDAGGEAAETDSRRETPRVWSLTQVLTAARSGRSLKKEQTYDPIPVRIIGLEEYLKAPYEIPGPERTVEFWIENHGLVQHTARQSAYLTEEIIEDALAAAFQFMDEIGIDIQPDEGSTMTDDFDMSRDDVEPTRRHVDWSGDVDYE